MWFVAASSERKERAAFGGLAWLKTLDLYSLTLISWATLAKSLIVTFSEMDAISSGFHSAHLLSICVFCMYITNSKSKCLNRLYGIPGSWPFQNFRAVWYKLYIAWFDSLFLNLVHNTIGFTERFYGLPEFCKPSLRPLNYTDEVSGR